MFMKKLLFLVFLGLLIYTPAKAQVPTNTFFLGDGKGYDVNGVQTYFCFGDNNCYDITGVFAFIREAQTTIANLQNTVDNLQNTVNNLQTPVASNTAPAQAPIVAGGSTQPATENLNNGQITCKDTYHAPTMVVTCSNTYSTLSAYFTSLTEVSNNGVNASGTVPTKIFQLTDVLSPRTSNFELRQNTHDNIGLGISVSYIVKDRNGQAVSSEITVPLE